MSDEKGQLWVDAATSTEGLSASTYNRIMFKFDSANLTVTLILSAGLLLTYHLFADDNPEDDTVLKIALLSAMWASIASTINILTAKILEKCSIGTRNIAEVKRKNWGDTCTSAAKELATGVIIGAGAGVATALRLPTAREGMVDWSQVAAAGSAAVVTPIMHGYLRLRSNQSERTALEESEETSRNDSHQSYTSMQDFLGEEEEEADTLPAINSGLAVEPSSSSPTQTPVPGSKVDLQSPLADTDRLLLTPQTPAKASAKAPAARHQTFAAARVEQVVSRRGSTDVSATSLPSVPFEGIKN